MRPAPRANRLEWNTRRDHISRTSRGPHTQSSMWPPTTQCGVPPVSNELLAIPTSSTDRSLSGRPPFSTRARRRTPTKPTLGRSSRKTRSRSSTRRRSVRLTSTSPPNSHGRTPVVYSGKLSQTSSMVNGSGTQNYSGTRTSSIVSPSRSVTSERVLLSEITEPLRRRVLYVLSISMCEKIHRVG